MACETDNKNLLESVQVEAPEGPEEDDASKVSALELPVHCLVLPLGNFLSGAGHKSDSKRQYIPVTGYCEVSGYRDESLVNFNSPMISLLSFLFYSLLLSVLIAKKPRLRRRSAKKRPGTPLTPCAVVRLSGMLAA